MMARSAVNIRAELTPAVPSGGVSRVPPTADAQPERRHSGYLFSPLVDFLLAGGGSIIVAAPVFWLIGDKVSAHPTALSISLVLALFINYPHFAHSYQLLYTGIGQRIFGPG